MHGFVAGRNHLPALHNIAALPIGNDAARFFDNWDKRLNVIRLQNLLNHQINMAARQKGIIITITAIPRKSHGTAKPVPNRLFICSDK